MFACYGYNAAYTEHICSYTESVSPNSPCFLHFSRRAGPVLWLSYCCAAFLHLAQALCFTAASAHSLIPLSLAFSLSRFPSLPLSLSPALSLSLAHCLLVSDSLSHPPSSLSLSLIMQSQQNAGFSISFPTLSHSLCPSVSLPPLSLLSLYSSGFTDTRGDGKGNHRSDGEGKS